MRRPKGVLTNDIQRLLADPGITVGVELVGGTGVAKAIQLDLLRAGKDVVTANKALLAEHGAELYHAARQCGRCIAFEASCAGGVPIIGAIRTGLAANNVRAMYGIVNGTCNYILSNMSAKDEEFAVALSQAQKRGFAEADPTLDISGGDSGTSWPSWPPWRSDTRFPEDIHVRASTASLEDIQYGREMGYCSSFWRSGS